MSLIFEWTSPICYYKFSQVTSAHDFLLVQGLHISHVSLTCGDMQCKLLPFTIRSYACIHSRARNDCVWTNFVMLLSVPVCAVMVMGIQKVLRPGRWGRRRHLLSSACSNNHARIRRSFSERCVGRCDCLTALELIWVQSVWVHRSDL